MPTLLPAVDEAPRDDASVSGGDRRLDAGPLVADGVMSAEADLDGVDAVATVAVNGAHAVVVCCGLDNLTSFNETR